MDYQILNKSPDVATAVVPHALDINGRAVPVGSSASASVLPVGSAAYASVVSLMRPVDTSAYAANDVMGAATGGSAALQFSGIAPVAGGEVILTTTQLEIDTNAIPAGMAGFRLYLYSSMPPSALGDNAAWDLPAGDRGAFLGYVDLGAPVDLGSTLYVEALQINKQVTAPAGGALFGYLVTTGAFTPASGTVHKITLHAAGF